MTAAVAHRGPDGEGFYRHAAGDGEVHLGHRRLSILDLTPTGAQPMVANGLAITYNGELYNAPRAARRAGGTGGPVPRYVGHRGPARGVAPLGDGLPATAAGHVRIRRVRRALRRARAGP